MYKFNKENYKKNIRNYYIIATILFLSIFILITFIIANVNVPDILLIVWAYICAALFFFYCMALIGAPFFFRNVKNFCKGYNIHILNGKIAYSTYVTEAVGIYTEKRNTYLINKVISYKEFKDRIIIRCNYTKKTVMNNDIYEEKKKSNSLVFIYKGISNIEEFKQELEKLKV